MADRSRELVDRVQQALASGTPLRIVGNDSKAFMGRSAGGETLSTATHAGLVEYEPTELVVAVRSGPTLAELNDQLQANGQCLGCEPPQFGGATVGGTLACNQSGPARPWLGSIRDHVLGLRLVNGRGEHLHFGGRVMKNVAGYDVSRLQAGAMGTLGLITEVTLRVFPRPEHQATTVLEMGAAPAGSTAACTCAIPGSTLLSRSAWGAAVASRCRTMGRSGRSSGSSGWISLAVTSRCGAFPAGRPQRTPAKVPGCSTGAAHSAGCAGPGCGPSCNRWRKAWADS
jgi:FAD/FMN-containing dehydrogenase